MSSTLTATDPLGEERQSRGRPIPCWTGRRALGVNHLPANCQERLLTIVYIKQGGIQGREGTSVKGGTGSMVGGVKKVKVDHACTRCSVRGDAGDEQDGRERGQAVQCSLCVQC